MNEILRRPILIVVGLALLALVACDGGGMNDEARTAIQDDLTSVQDRLDEIESQMADLESGDADQEAIAAAVRDALAEARANTEEAQANLEPAEADPAVDAPAGDPLAPADPAQPAF